MTVEQSFRKFLRDIYPKWLFLLPVSYLFHEKIIRIYEPCIYMNNFIFWLSVKTGMGSGMRGMTGMWGIGVRMMGMRWIRVGMRRIRVGMRRIRGRNEGNQGENLFKDTKNPSYFLVFSFSFLLLFSVATLNIFI